MCIKNSSVRALFCIVLVALVLLSGCSVPPLAGGSPTPTIAPASTGASAPTATSASSEPTEAEIAQAMAALRGKIPIEIGAARAYPDLTQAVSKAKIVVLGMVVEVGPVFNGSRDPDKGTPQSEWYIVGQLYKVRVDKYIKGSGPNEIWVGQAEGDLDNTVPHTLVNIRAAQRLHKHIPINPGKRYAFLIYDTEKIPELGNLEMYAQVTDAPQRFVFNDDDTAEVQALDQAVATKYPTKTADQLIDDLQKAAAAQKK